MLNLSQTVLVFEILRDWGQCFRDRNSATQFILCRLDDEMLGVI
jgi:hypothetical protein